MARTALTVLPLIAAMAACTPAEQAAVMTLGPDPVLDGGTFSTGGGIDVAAQIMPIGGMTGLCGVWAESEQQSVLSKGTAGKVMHTGSAYLDGAALHRDLSFMRKTAPVGAYAGQPANCVKTQRPWSAGDEGKRVQIRLPKQVVHREIEDDGGVSVAVIFSQTGPGTANPTLRSLIFGN